MFTFIKKSLGNKIMAAVTICILLFVAAEIIMRIYFGARDRIDLMEITNADLAASTYSGIKYPMSVGDSEAVRRVLADIRVKMAGVEVFVCDAGQRVVWSTHPERINTTVADAIGSAACQETLDETLRTGIVPLKSVKDEVGGIRHLITIQPISNHEDCFHCHGAQKKILGGMIIRNNMEQTLRTVTAQRNRTILITIIGIPVILLIMYLLVGKFVKRPVRQLADTAKRFAEGEMAVSVPVTTSDEIGVLGDTFNYMVRRIASFSRKLEQEVEKKTSLLNERTVLISCLHRANNQLREIDQVKSRFLANMSHELRTPMNSIIGYTDLLLDEVDGPVNPEQRNSLERITSNARHLLNLINDILDLSRIEAGKTELDVQQFSLPELVTSVLPIFEPLVDRKGLSLATSFADDLPVVYGDPDKIRQVLVNLIGNAVKFTETGGVIIRCKLSQRGIREGEPPVFAEVSVEDTGIGIKEEDLDKVFDKFVQADLSTVRQHEGTGLGLSIAKQLVSMHMGLIWATSQYGKGSQFTFTLPLREDILACPPQPVVESAMAEALARCFRMDKEAFLKEPRQDGRLMRCWEYSHCGETGCPAYKAAESRCWLILGTHCEGLRIAAYPEKADFCKGCEVIRDLVLESVPFSEGAEG